MLSTWIRKWLGRLTKITLLGGLFVGCMLIVLGNIGGQGDSYKTMIEEFVEDTAGGDSRISRLNNMRFFPNIIIDFDDLGFFENEEDDTPNANIGRLHVVMSFWDVLSQNGRIKYFRAENIHAESGAIIDKEISIESLGIREQENGSSELKATGNVGAQTFAISTALDSKGSGFARSYTIAPERHLDATLGDLKISGHFGLVQDMFALENLSVTLRSENILSGSSIILNSDRIVFKNAAPEKAKAVFDYIDTVLGTSFSKDLNIVFE